MHLAVIPDGNRRFARKNKLGLSQAYQQGFAKMEEVAQWCSDEGINSLSVWALSLDNFQRRSSAELGVLFKLMEKEVEKALEDSSEKPKTKFFGKIKLLPKSLQEKMRSLEEKTSCGELSLNVGIAYSGRDELLSAIQLAAQEISKGRKIDEQGFESFLYLQQSPDLIIRTGNAQRLSGFMPWQSVYSELFFSPKLWPEFQKHDLRKALDFYSECKRNYGK
jgi:undecaprenyl diphosphate synthase